MLGILDGFSVVYNNIKCVKNKRNVVILVRKSIRFDVVNTKFNNRVVLIKFICGESINCLWAVIVLHIGKKLRSFLSLSQR